MRSFQNTNVRKGQTDTDKPDVAKCLMDDQHKSMEKGFFLPI